MILTFTSLIKAAGDSSGGLTSPRYEEGDEAEG